MAISNSFDVAIIFFEWISDSFGAAAGRSVPRNGVLVLKERSRAARLHSPSSQLQHAQEDDQEDERGKRVRDALRARAR